MREYTQMRVLKLLVKQLKPIAKADGRVLYKYVEKVLKDHIKDLNT